MQLESADEVLAALRESGLFAPDEFVALERELAAFADARAAMAHLFKRDRVTRYQLGKVLSGRAADLFIGPYVITDRLGAGGMGKVYRGREAATGKPVALKVVRSALVENPTVRGRYAREVQTAGQLNHPNIVRVLDAGEAGGRVYMAMEFVDGIDLARMMREFEMLAVPEACEYARQAALGLAHAHAGGFVHRDIKPSNIVVAGERHLPQATEPAIVKLLDLGLSRAIDPLDMVAPDLTRDHTVVGTPDYMAPEQARDSKGVDARADLYGLGCTLYFLLTGRVPFASASGAIEKILAHQAEMPPPLQALRPEIPAAVAEIVMRLMAKRPDDRIQTAAEVAELLAPHARYPKDAPPVEVVPRRRPKEAHVDTRSSRSTLPASPGGPAPSLGSLELFEPSHHDAAQPAPPPRTPPPKVKSEPPPPEDETPAPKPRPRPRPKKAKRRARPLIPVLWALVVLWVCAVMAAAFWLAGR